MPECWSFVVVQVTPQCFKHRKVTMSECRFIGVIGTNVSMVYVQERSVQLNVGYV